MALPGEYGVKVKAGAQELIGTVRVVLDPAVQASPADMQAQLDASFTMMAMQGRVNAIIERVDGLMTQIAAFEATIAPQSPAPAYRADVRAALGQAEGVSRHRSGAAPSWTRLSPIPAITRGRAVDRRRRGARVSPADRRREAAHEGTGGADRQGGRQAERHHHW